MPSKFPTIRDKTNLYDSYAAIYWQRTKDFVKLIAPDYKIFLDSLPGKKILDLGCGPGRDSAVFKKRGFKPFCLDASEEMLKLCRNKGLKTIKMDIEKLRLPTDKFAGVWAYTSLTTIPKKKVWKIINAKLHRALTKNGILFLGLIEGNFEGWKKPDKKYALRRYASRYQINEVVNHLKNKFQLVYFRRIGSEKSGRNTYLNFLFKKLG